MNRLTNDREISTVACCRNVCGNNCAPALVWDRLKAIEDILGDRYEIEELKQRWGYMGLIGKTVYGIRRRYTAKLPKGVIKTYDRAVGSPWILERYPEECYVAERVCVRSDLAKLGATVFLTREEADEKIGGAGRA